MARDAVDPVLDERTKEFGARMRRLYATDVGQKSEFYLRNFIVVAVTTGVALLMGSWIPLAWLAIYITIIAGFAGYLIRNHDSPTVGETEWHIAVGLSTLACVFYATLPLYLWVLPNPSLNFIAWCGVFGLAMLNLTRHTFDKTLARIDMAVVCGCILAMGGVWMYQLGPSSESALVAAGTLACAAYYSFAHRDGLALRTKLIANERRSAESAKLQAVGQLTTGIAHDFNNILTVVIGNIELARLAQTDQDKHHSLDEAHHAADRAAILVSQLLAFSRRAQLRPVAIEPVRFASGFVTTMERLLPASIILRHHVSQDLPPLRCDRTLLETALLNLVINGRDAMEGRGNLSLLFDLYIAKAHSDALPELAPGPYARITVADTGPGIPPELLNRVVEPFFTTKPIGQGSGLGLAMVKGFSEQSGGALNVASTPKGTEVAIYLPIPPVAPLDLPKLLPAEA